MGYCKFLTDLFEDGRVTVDPISPLDEDELTAGDQLIADYERRVRLEAPGGAPALDPLASRWAAQRLHRACQLSVYRDYDQETVDLELDVPFSEAITPSVHYSVDLVFRFLPDLAKFAGSAAEHDPLLDYLHMWAMTWPLSSVGMKEVGDVDVAVLTSNESLLQTYADRVIAEDDRSRLTDTAVKAAICRAIGPFSELAPRVAQALLDLQAADDESTTDATQDDSNKDKAGT